MRKHFLLWSALLLGLAVPVFLKNRGRALFFEVQAPLWVAGSWVEEALSYGLTRAQSKGELIAAGERWARMAHSYELAVQQNSALREELARLEGFLGLPGHRGYESHIARVIQAEYTPMQHGFLIRKGRLQGIKKGAGVVCASGVVGRVAEAYLYTARVELVSSPGFQMVAQVGDDLRPVLFGGKPKIPGAAPSGLAQNIPFDIQPESPQIPLVLKTSGLGSAFPAGLNIGVLEALKPRSDGLFQEAEVRLCVPLLSVREVCVLVPIEPLTVDYDEPS